ncbi:hypothetical protein [Vagococcus luciliae]|uniref:AAT family amino acid transporter n=1 Tax=Vagococcus luciliae TaxID=2920380 RepID=A0ABY5P1T4_9ENTE|nr:hypothetical protein [Vagococcus luciliae]UUV99783.1 hypothetical protein G314FT_19520 [Vagococcus luciliae]
MENIVIAKRIKHPLLSGIVSVIFLILFASAGWIIWSNVWQLVIGLVGGESVNNLSTEIQGHFFKESVEGTFFWLVISTWVWFSLNLGNYGKHTRNLTHLKTGIRYTLMAFLVGIIGFSLFVTFLGLWWEPFSWQVLFRPENDVQALLAIKGWSAINFFALSVILTQIPLVSLFGKYPFSQYSQSDWSISFGTLFLGLFLALFNWIVFIVPSFFQLQIDGVAITQIPFGSWSTAIAWCQLFIFFFLLPAEGAEGYPQKLFTTRQPISGLIGLAIAVIGAFVMLPILSQLLTPLATEIGIDPDLAVASFVLTIINVLLTWHHHFDDYPNKEVVPSAWKRIVIQLIIVITIGSVLGILWLKTLQLWPFGGNHLGLGHPMLGILGGQFVYMMPMLFMNTFFDKWPMSYYKEK